MREAAPSATQRAFDAHARGVSHPDSNGRAHMLHEFRGDRACQCCTATQDEVHHGLKILQIREHYINMDAFARSAQFFRDPVANASIGTLTKGRADWPAGACVAPSAAVCDAHNFATGAQTGLSRERIS